MLVTLAIKCFALVQYLSKRTLPHRCEKPHIENITTANGKPPNLERT